MNFKTRLDELENFAEHGILRFWETPELWLRRHPWRYALLVVAAAALLAAL